MPIHVWTRVPAGLFHDFHQSWVVGIAQALNDGLLPDGLCALIDVPDPPPKSPEFDESHYARKGNRICIRRGLTDVVSVLHVMSPGDKRDRRAKFKECMAGFLSAGVHVLLIDLFPPRELLHGLANGPFAAPTGKDRTVASYRCSDPPEAFIETVAVGDAMPDMPLFLTKEAHIPVPLEVTYMANWKASAKPLRDMLEGDHFFTGATMCEAWPFSWCTAFFATTAFFGKSRVSGSPVFGFGS